MSDRKGGNNSHSNMKSQESRCGARIKKKSQNIRIKNQIASRYGQSNPSSGAEMNPTTSLTKNIKKVANKISCLDFSWTYDI
jgi:hypothetical protein